jgi:hypothetical protein
VSRFKIPIIASVVLLALTVIVKMVVVHRLMADSERIASVRVAASLRMLDKNARLEALELINWAERAASRPAFVQVFNATEGSAERTNAAFAAVTAEHQILENEGRAPDLVAVVDSRGVGVARDLDVRALDGDKLGSKFPSIGRALSGVSNKDIWSYQGRQWKVAAAPIRGRSGSLGAVLIGYVVKATEARQYAELLSTDVAFFLDGRISATSFTQAAEGGAGVAEDTTRVQQLATAAFGPAGFAKELASRGRGRVGPVTVELAGERFVAVAATLQGNIVNRTSGAIVSLSLDRVAESAAAAGTGILATGLLAVLICLSGMALTARRFQRPIEQLETGVTEIINGNIDYSFPRVSRDVDGLANGLNVLLARLLGRPDPDAEEGAPGASVGPSGAFTGRWGLQVDDATTGTGHRPILDDATVALAQEPEDAYLRRVFGEYLAARRIAGQRDDGLTLDAFRKKLAENEQKLIEKFGCRSVRFRILSTDKQVTLKPVPIYQ